MQALERKGKVFILTRTIVSLGTINLNEITPQLIKVNPQLIVLTSIESTGDYLVLHGVTKEL